MSGRIESAGAISVGERLAAAYRGIGARVMRGLPVYNPTLDVRSVGFRPHAGAVLGVVVTPWFMNIVLVGATGEAPPGSTIQHRFPAGRIDFTVGEVAGIGRVDSASLFSPMFAFDAPASAERAAEAALAALFEPAPASTGRSATGRRALLFAPRPGDQRP